MFPIEEYADRRDRAFAAFADAAVDLAVACHPVDLLYLSGTSRASYLFMRPPGEAWLAALRAGDQACMDSNLPVEDFSDRMGLEALLKRNLPRVRRLGLARDVTSSEIVIMLHEIFPQAEMIDLGPFFRRQREIKSSLEIELIRLAGKQLDGAFKTAASLLRLGQSELELSIRIEAYLRRKGHPGLARWRRLGAEAGMGFVLAGSSTLRPTENETLCAGSGLSPMVPFGPSEREFRAGEPVLFDYCGCCAGYMADQGRMLSIGPPPDEASWAYEAMKQILRRVEAELGPGLQTGKLFSLAMREARILGYEEQFMGGEQYRLPFIGHGVGMELDEQPYLAEGRKDKLEPGMTLAIEPKVLLPDIGVIGVENTYLITPDGYEVLTFALDDWRQVEKD